MIDPAEFEATWLAPYIAEPTGLGVDEIIRGNLNRQIPDGLFCTTLLISSTQLGTNADTGWRTIQGGSSGTGLKYQAQVIVNSHNIYSIQFFREGALAAAMKFRGFCSSPLGREAVDRMGCDPNTRQQLFNVSFMRCSDVRRLDAVVSAEYEERASVDLHLLIADRFKQTAPAMGDVPIAAFSDGQEISTKVEV